MAGRGNVRGLGPLRQPGPLQRRRNARRRRRRLGAKKQHPTKLTPNEQYTHITLSSLLSSTLLLGCDMTKLDPLTVSLLSNDEILAIDQDPLVKQAVSVFKDRDRSVYRKELEDGSIAVGLFNCGNDPATITARWTDLKIAGPQTVSDLWRQNDLGKAADSVSATVNPHGVVLYRLTPAQ
jgi:alpha-galactosidase